jgi:hypothetical protein
VGEQDDALDVDGVITRPQEVLEQAGGLVELLAGERPRLSVISPPPTTFP